MCCATESRMTCDSSFLPLICIISTFSLGRRIRGKQDECSQTNVKPTAITGLPIEGFFCRNAHH